VVKKIQAIIRPYKVQDLKQALALIEVSGMTVSDVRGYGRQKGHTEIYRGTEYSLDFTPKALVEVVVPDDLVQRAIQVVHDTCQTGKIGDGKIFIQPVEQAVRIRTEETGDKAV
jgi:nitrogen regulatory protein P-II 1